MASVDFLLLNYTLLYHFIVFFVPVFRLYSCWYDFFNLFQVPHFSAFDLVLTSSSPDNASLPSFHTPSNLKEQPSLNSPTCSLRFPIFLFSWRSCSITYSISFLIYNFFFSNVSIFSASKYAYAPTPCNSFSLHLQLRWPTVFFIYMKSLEGPEGHGGEDLGFLLIGLNWTKFTCDLFTKSIILFPSIIQFNLGPNKS